LDSIPERLLPIDKHIIEYLDLTENHLDDLRFLIELPNLRTLILDKNRINSNVKIPRLDMLHTIWINHNQIANLSVFIQTLVTQCPQLKYLSMMNNPAAPSFFNGGSYKQYVDYRHYVISQLPRLIMLDDRQVSLEERQEAERIYTPMTLTRREKVSLKNQRLNLANNSQ
jgi:Leucine-rich repeat (LRR) protein